MASLLSYPVCIAVTIALLADAFSVALQGKNPSLALSANRLNRDARIAEAISALDSDPRRARSLLSVGIVTSPADARFYSMLGILAEDDGQEKEAVAFYRNALEILPTEIQALTRMLNYSLASQQYREAVDCLEWIARRWPDYWPQVRPALLVIMQDPQARAELAMRFVTSERLRGLLLSALMEKVDGLPLAYSLIMEWRNLPGLDMTSDINALTYRYIWAKQYAAAFALFRLTIGAESAADLVYNGEFESRPSGSPFDWRFEKQAGLSLSLVERPMTRPEGADLPKPERVLSIHFLDTPIVFKNVFQMVRLAPARYRMSIRYSSKSLRGPGPVRAAITCAPERKQLGVIEFASGDSGALTATADFDVPDNRCPMQMIYFFTPDIPASWRNRYAGEMLIDSVRIELLGQS